jgi:hypothetical protein
METFHAYKSAAGNVVELIAEGDALAVIIALLPYCDTVDLAELEKNHVPRERLRAVNDESRTRPITVPGHDTHTIQTKQILREYQSAVVERFADGE